MLLNKKIIFLMLFIFPQIFVFGTIIYIPGDFPTIQEGINFAVMSDTVLVQPGVYYENINYNGKNIVIGSLFLITQDSTYIADTVIDGTHSGNVVKFKNGESCFAVLTGFTITNGLAEYFWNYHYGGGIICANSNPTITDCIITGNIATPYGKGGGVFCGISCAKFINVIITDNYASDTGGGIQMNVSSHVILNNVTISNNNATWGGGMYIYGDCNPIISYVTIFDNIASSEGGGIICHVNCNPILSNLTVSENYSPLGAGIFVGSNCYPEVINSIFWNNIPSEIYQSGGVITITYSDIQGGWTGLGNMNSDPLFIDSVNGDFHLQENSPCIDAGDPNSPLDPDGTIVDMGAYYYDQSTNVNNNYEIKYADIGALNYPNPFYASGSSGTTISYTTISEGNVCIEIYDIKGRIIRTLNNIIEIPGKHSVVWNGRDIRDKLLSSGIYFYKVKINGDTKALRKCILLK
jgi:hypothetical protein